MPNFSPLVLLSFLLAACSPAIDDDTLFGSSVTPMDHDPSLTYVNDVFIDGNWVGSAGTGGSTVANGITLPVKFRDTQPRIFAET